MKLQTKLLLTTLSLALIPILAVTGIVLWRTQTAFDEFSTTANESLDTTKTLARESLIETGLTDLNHVAKDVLAMCQAQQELLQQKVTYDLNVARDVLAQSGQLNVADETVEWRVTNQYTGSAQSVELPKLKFGETAIEPVGDFSTNAPVVDHVRELVGGTCTIFQRMNSTGDMLRVCTNVRKTDGTRAIGTYIPATNPDGGANPVVSKVLSGETFYGRAYVVNAWYITAYEPIYDANRQVVGMLYVGVPQESVTALRQAIMDTQVGQTGYVFVLNATGQTRGEYVISHEGKRDGENIWDAKDADGRLFIQDLCATARELGPGEIGEIRYPWKNAGDTEARQKIAKIAYFEPWDWAIGVGAYEDEFYGAVYEMDEQIQKTLTAVETARSDSFRSMLTWSGGIAAVTLVVSVVISLVVVRGVAGPIDRAIAQLTEGSSQMADASEQVSETSEQLASGASQQAASLEETSSALQEMAATTRANAESAQQASALSDQARDAAHEGDQTMTRLNSAMDAINESSGQISKIIKVIEEIAFQTNLLALNAAVEAARAGEHGKGFAVVAEEVRNLAQRAAGAAKETTGLIEQSVGRAHEGTDVARDVAEVLSGIVKQSREVSELINGIARATGEQSQGVDQVSKAVHEIDLVTQQNAAGAEESASAAKELSAQAASMYGIVGDLAKVVGRRADSTRAAEPGNPPKTAAQPQQARPQSRGAQPANFQRPAQQQNVDEDLSRF